MKTFGIPGGRLRPMLVAVLVAAVSLTAVFASSGSARPSSTGPKPTIVLVHGAWGDASGWNDEIARLQRLGYPVLALANPLRSLSSDSAYIASVLRSVSGPIVLVGHSYGGAVITNAATGNPNVKALVYVDAFVPEQGESMLQLAGRFPGSQLPAAISQVPYTQPDGSTGIDVYINQKQFHDVFAADVPAAKAALMAAEQRPVSFSALAEPSGPPAWRTIPSWYLIGTDDHAVPPITQRFMAKRAKSHVVAVDSSHASLVSHPEAVTNLILAAVQGTS